jgi:hypothetical protein
VQLLLQLQAPLHAHTHRVIYTPGTLSSSLPAAGSLQYRSIRSGTFLRTTSGVAAVWPPAHNDSNAHSRTCTAEIIFQGVHSGPLTTDQVTCTSLLLLLLSIPTWAVAPLWPFKQTLLGQLLLLLLPASCHLLEQQRSTSPGLLLLLLLPLLPLLLLLQGICACSCTLLP